MQVILTEDIKNLGSKNSILEVSNGYFLNYLYPKKLAKMVTPDLVERYSKQKSREKAGKEMLLSRAEEYREILEKAALEFVAKAEHDKKSDTHTLYAGVSEKDIAQKIQDDLKIPVTKEQILLKKPIKTTGTHTATVTLAPKKNADIQIIVKPE